MQNYVRTRPRKATAVNLKLIKQTLKQAGTDFTGSMGEWNGQTGSMGEWNGQSGKGNELQLCNFYLALLGTF